MESPRPQASASSGARVMGQIQTKVETPEAWLERVATLRKEGMTMMVVTHEMGFARKVAHRVIFMDAGKIVEDAKKDDFFGTPRSERAQLFLSKILHH